MKKITQNTFGDGMNKDLNPLTTPNSVLTDALNATIITFNGNEFVLQNDMGNGIVERAKLSPGFLPLGIKEYGGIIYVASYNPETEECEVGSFPSPERDITGSNKIENQTGLRDANFLTNEYQNAVLRVSGEFSPEEILVQLKKLNQQEVLQLSPGDMYVTTFQINDPGVPSGGQDSVTNQLTFDSIFSWNPADKKIFSISFYKIDGSNNIKLLEDTLPILPFTGTPIDEDLYSYYTENSKGSIVVGVELNNIDNFSTAVRETSRRSDVNKKIRIESIAESDSAVKFEGIRVDAESTAALDGTVSNVSFHVDKIDNNIDKVSIDIADLAENDSISVDVTPYTQFGYIPSLMKSFELQMGVNLSGNQVNDVFKWRTSNTFVELDFDFKLEVDNPMSLYLEFYDMWSNYSVITTYDSPSIYGPMRLTIPTVNEPRTDIFNATQSGGTNFTQLRDNTDLINKPILVDQILSGGTNWVRRDFALRRNHFYIVRICGIESVIEDGEIVDRVYHDVHKAMYTTNAYNELYDQQTNVAFDDPDFIPDFTEVAYPLDKINYSSTLSSSPPTTNSINGQLPPEGTGAGQWPTTLVNNSRRLFRIGQQPTDSHLTVADTYLVNQNHQLNIQLLNKDLIYSQLKAGILVLTSETASASIPGSSIEENFNDPDIPTESQGTITIPTVTGEGSYSVNISTSTKRKIRGTPTLLQVNMSRIEPGVTLDTLLYENNNKGIVCPCSTDQGRPTCNPVNFTLYRTTFQGNRSRGGCEAGNSDWNILMRVRNHVNGFLTNIRSGRNINTPIDTDNDADHSTWDFNAEALTKQFFTLGIGSYMGSNIERTNQLLFVARAANGGNRKMVLFGSRGNDKGINDLSLIKSQLAKLAINQVITELTDNYYIGPIKFHEGVTTRYKDLKLELTTKFDVLSKTYVFETIFRNIDATVRDFTPNLINDYINSINPAGHIKINPTLLSDSGFIPFVTETNNFEREVNFNLPDIVVNRSINSTILSLFESAFSEYLARLGQMQSEIEEFDVDAPVKALTNEPNIIDFARAFAWDAVNNELTISSTAETENVLAITRSGGNFHRHFDKVIEPLFPL